MRAWRLPTLLLVISSLVFFLLTAPVYTIRDKYASEAISNLGRLPSEVVEALSMEFQGVLADMLFLKTTVFMGVKVRGHVNPSDEEWGLIIDMLEMITDLDKKFWDPYVFAEMMLPWQAGRLKETNQLLLKAAENKPDDYRPYYFLGFNHFYFEKKPKLAAKYLRLAAVKPGCPDYLKNLAARISVYGDQTVMGINFLQDLLRDTQLNEKRRNYLLKRLKALKAIHDLEMAIRKYYHNLKKKPVTVDDLVNEGFISDIPAEPYGGEWYIMPNGRVYSTSELVEKKSQSMKN